MTTVCTASTPKCVYDGTAWPLLSCTPPDHFPSFFSQSTVPKLVVRSTFALKEESLAHLADSASMSSEDGKVFAITCERVFWIWR